MMIGNVPQLQATLITIPYKDQCLKFNLLLPKTINGLDIVGALFANALLGDMQKKQIEVFVQFDMPSFEITTSLQLNENLKKVVFMRTLIKHKSTYFMLCIVDGNKHGFLRWS